MADGEAVRKHARARDRALNILDRVFPFLCLPLMVVMFDISSFQRFQPATDKTFYTVFLPPILAVAIGLPRMLLTMGAKRGTRLWRRNTSQLFAVVIGIAVLVILGWKPHPGGLYVLSGALDRSEGKVVRLEVHDFINRETSYRGQSEHTRYAVVSFEDRPATRFEINLGRLAIPYAHVGHHDLQARWHPGVLGLSWIDRDTLQILPDIYNLEFLGEGDRPRRFLELKGRRLLLVGAGYCVPRGADEALRSLEGLAKRDVATVIRFVVSADVGCRDREGPAKDPVHLWSEQFPLMARHGTEWFLDLVTNGGRPLEPLAVVMVQPDGQLTSYGKLSDAGPLARFRADAAGWR